MSLPQLKMCQVAACIDPAVAAVCRRLHSQEMGLPERQAERALTTLSGIGFASPTAVDISVGDMFRTFTDERYQATVDAVEDALTKQQLVWCARNLQVCIMGCAAMYQVCSAGRAVVMPCIVYGLEPTPLQNAGTQLKPKATKPACYFEFKHRLKPLKPLSPAFSGREWGPCCQGPAGVLHPAS